MNEVLPMIVDMFNKILELFQDVFDGLDAWDYIFGAFIIVTIYRMLLRPILGGGIKSGSSDKARKSTSKNEVED